jgi:pantoate--beta-alanine ligase
MGALHVGHASLIDASVADGHFTVVTIFVNPTQFGPNEDFDRYPRTWDADVALCRAHHAGAIFAPTVAEMYPLGNGTIVSVVGLGEGLCGRSRPGHFDGVCTVVSKLFNIVGPDVAYFGQKDAQQAAIIQRMASDLNMPLEVRVCPTVREDDGLALSSRNAYLSAEERSQAPAVYGALQLAAGLIGGGESDPAAVQAAMRAHLAERASLGAVEYIEIVDPHSLASAEAIAGTVLVALTVRFGKTRLIDNLRVDWPRKKG